MAAKKKKNKPSFLKKVLIVLAVLIIGGAVAAAYQFYAYVYQPNVTLEENKVTYIHIPTGAAIDQVVAILDEKGIIDNMSTFKWVAERKNYHNHVYPGRYLIREKMSNNELINLLRSGEQAPVNVTFSNVRTKEELAGIVSKQIEADSASLLKMMNSDEHLYHKYRMRSENILTMVIPNTYEFYWNTSAEEFLNRMAREYKSFWTAERLNKADEIGLSQTEVSILASIVQKETSKADEMPAIAGVYINRLERGMRLQADPTLIYALGDFTIRRVLNEHKKIDSPYNTYLYKGLPPGPISLPSITALDAVLNYKKHDYLYFCAKADMSGYHAFAETYAQHLVNARKFQRELNRQGVYR